MRAALVTFVLLYAGLLAGWALGCAVLRRPRGPAHTGGLVLLELTVVVQAVLDVLGSVTGGPRATEPITHAGYLVAAVLLLPLLPALTRPVIDAATPSSASADRAWGSTVVALACVALVVVEVRLVATGTPP